MTEAEAIELINRRAAAFAPQRAAYQAHLWQPGRIYAAVFREGVVAKVGFTINVAERLEQLSRRFGEKLELINSIPAYRQQERWLHRFFHRSYRIPVDGSRETYAYDAIKSDLDAMWRTGKTPAPAHVFEMIAEGLITVPVERCK